MCTFLRHTDKKFIFVKVNVYDSGLYFLWVKLGMWYVRWKGDLFLKSSECFKWSRTAMEVRMF